MIAVLVAMLPLVTCIWLSHMMTRRRSAPVQELTAAEPSAVAPAPMRMDDAPAVEAPAWTALDEMQLNRLLAEASDEAP